MLSLERVTKIVLLEVLAVYEAEPIGVDVPLSNL
jgi:hypothetical protein